MFITAPQWTAAPAEKDTERLAKGVRIGVAGDSTLALEDEYVVALVPIEAVDASSSLQKKSFSS